MSKLTWNGVNDLSELVGLLDNEPFISSERYIELAELTAFTEVVASTAPYHDGRLYPIYVNFVDVTLSIALQIGNEAYNPSNTELHALISPLNFDRSYVPILLYDDLGNKEIIYVVDNGGSVLRAREGTVARLWPVGTKVKCVASADSQKDLMDYTNEQFLLPILAPIQISHSDKTFAEGSSRMGVYTVVTDTVLLPYGNHVYYEDPFGPFNYTPGIYFRINFFDADEFGGSLPEIIIDQNTATQIGHHNAINYYLYPHKGTIFLRAGTKIVITIHSQIVASHLTRISNVSFGFHAYALPMSPLTGVPYSDVLGIAYNGTVIPKESVTTNWGVVPRITNSPRGGRLTGTLGGLSVLGRVSYYEFSCTGYLSIGVGGYGGVEYTYHAIDSPEHTTQNVAFNNIIVDKSRKLARLKELNPIFNVEATDVVYIIQVTAVGADGLVSRIFLYDATDPTNAAL